MPHLLRDEQLEKSSVVANSRMNRERVLMGVNSYTKELGVNPLAWIESRRQDSGQAAWLDLCCGRGEALVEAAQRLSHVSERVYLHGLDLVPMFRPRPDIAWLKLEATSLHYWEASRTYDLITCVHGLHYIGDKLGLIARAVSWLTPDGLFLAHLDLDNLRRDDGQPFARYAQSTLKSNGFTYGRGRHLLSRRGNAPCGFGFHYVGADDCAGPNYTGQEAVHSYYRPR